MTLTIYNSLTRTKDPFTPLKNKTVTMYVCGMTVYSDAHIGHARTYVAFDIIRRYLEYLGNTVLYVQNITDVDDKIIAAANKENVNPLDYSKTYTKRCLDDLAALGIRPADFYPKASENIPTMIAMIQQLLDKGYGYTAGGDVYFSVDRFDDYGKLSGQRPDEMKTGARIDPGDLKKSPLDFALWKAAKPDEPSWDSPWGRGRPGWHIECSAMSGKYLGLPFDIHGGGMDLRFPHHENEIAQAQAATGKPFARYWIHIGLLTINGEKMSKSLGNFVTVRDLIAKWDPEVVRMFFAQTQYRSPPDYTEKALGDVAKSLERLHRVKERLQTYAATKDTADTGNRTPIDSDYESSVERLSTEFSTAMNDDFNTPKAFAALFDFVNASNKYFEATEVPNPALCHKALQTYVHVGNVLTLFQERSFVLTEDPALVAKLEELSRRYPVSVKNQTMTGLLDALLAARTAARKNKQWDVADGIRKDLEGMGFEIQDTAQGSAWRKR